MGLDAAWAIGVTAQFALMGVPATVTRPAPNDTPIETTIIWVDPATIDDPTAARFPRRERVRIAAVRREAVSEAPKGTSIEAAETQGGTPKNWIVDGTERVDTDQLRVKVIEQV
jgi:hypothetical protein